MASAETGFSPMSWAHRDRETTRWANYGLAFCLGIVSASAYDRVPDLWNKGAKLEHVQSVVVPQLKRKIVVEHSKAVTATRAKNAVCQSLIDNGDIGSQEYVEKCL